MLLQSSASGWRGDSAMLICTRAGFCPLGVEHSLLVALCSKAKLL